jgi:hypothetical protein
MTPDEPQADPAPASDISELCTQAISVPTTPASDPGPHAQTVPARAVDVSDVIDLIESNNGRADLRFEPGQYAKKSTHAFRTIAAIINANGCSMETAHVIYSCSWGAFQIMGFNLYDPDDIACKVSVFEFVADMDRQRLAFFVFLHRVGIAFSLADLRDPVKRLHFATVYNGPGNAQIYADKIRRAMSAFGVS